MVRLVDRAITAVISLERFCRANHGGDNVCKACSNLIGRVWRNFGQVTIYV